ncbi:LLM class flavin-dependent oxidoreductase [Psychrobacillus psychrotolerans]|uniref:LLM class flavin-dependent oxidoreductase n=1 Tax=Psychrobacillus psychrotolerans TaxID=126156 RepID=UPI0033159969
MEKYRIDQSKGMEFGLYTLGDHMPNPHTGERISAAQRLQEIIELAKLAEQAGIDFFSVGESHQEYFATQAHTVVLAAIAQATNTIKIASSSSIISTSDPVRVYEDFATIDLLSKGRAEIVAGRASRVGLFELLGYDIRYYEELYEAQEGSLPIWRAVGGHPASAIKAGHAGVPMFLATLGGPASSFKRSIDAYRDAAKSSGFEPDDLPVATAGFFYAAETTQQAQDEYYPYINEGMKLSNGGGYPRDAFYSGAYPHNVMNIGSPQQIIEKILYQHELFGHQRYIGQMDFGGVPFEKLMKNIELIGTEILPAIKKYTAK